MLQARVSGFLDAAQQVRFAQADFRLGARRLD